MEASTTCWSAIAFGCSASPTGAANLDAILFDDCADLRKARRPEDARISRYIEALSDADIAGTIRYRTFVEPADIEQELAPAPNHFFNHQTNHRGQAHGLITAIAGEAPSFDLIIYQRETGQGALRKIG